ncbi:MAG: YifB family Mg chelatase-like AAA ATPase [Dehalococcoidia bacterium]|nr:Competence protein ComM [Chloroflexota bacterium]MBT9160343.1 Competence protein ComM [Chloroflexota bacterium]MBT9162242.1 Competence protein ComM [Chloroflexota bacterium]
MLAKVNSAAVFGLEGRLVEVEVDISGGLPSMTIVGLPDTAVQESRERVRSAIRNAGCTFPGKRITVNLAPADLKKAGPAYDLPIAVGVLLSSEQVAVDLSGALFLGELSLDGSLRHTHGVLSMASMASEKGLSPVFVPAADAREAALIQGIRVIPVESLTQLVAYLRGGASIADYVMEDDPLKAAERRETGIDMAHIKGQEHAKRAMEVAAAGGHNLIMSGPPGGGKTLLARSLPSILPEMTPDESLETTKIYSVSGLLPRDTPLISQRPFRSPHYTVSHIGLVGGGHWPRPGEISLSHRGVLFLDELPEFGHAVLEVLRQPLEDRVVTITRAQGSMTYPSSFMLVGAMNPCPCGYYGDPVRQCTCPSALVSRYQKRISGPLLDRIDIFVEVPRIEYEKLADERLNESSAAIRARVEAARLLQRERFDGSKLTCNADMTPIEIRAFCQTEPGAQSLLQSAVRQLSLSARSFHRILKLGRTIADLDGAGTIGAAHLAEALQYRPRSLV